VADLPVTKIEIVPPTGILYAGTSLGYTARALVRDGRESEDAEPSWSSNRPRIASVDRFGTVTGVAPGTAVLSARVGGVMATQTVRVAPNPIAQLRVSGPGDKSRTGDVVHFKVEALSAAGRPVPGVQPVWSVTGIQSGDDFGARVSTP
jgi:hypothetical protein